MNTNLVRRATALITLTLGTALYTPAADAQQATTTGTIRGTISGVEGRAPLAGARIVATSVETGVRRGAESDERGRYSIPFLDPGRYNVRVQLIGYRPGEEREVRVALAEIKVLDFPLESAPTQLAEVRVTAATEQLIEPQKTGTSSRITETQIRDLPTLGRNFEDLVQLVPGVTDIGNPGSGGGQSIGGGRPGHTNVLMDGANNTEGFFGGDARGGDRAPFSYSIEAVKEIQVITASYDVERGNFVGGTVNAVTKSGTNELRGSGFIYGRGAELFGIKSTRRDFAGRQPIDFRRRQYGGFLSGPIIRDRAHFFIALDKQTAADPAPVFTALSTEQDQRISGIHPDTLARFIAVARNVYGVDLSTEMGQFSANTNEEAFFGRLDWQISDNHKLTLRDNYTNTNAFFDRLTVGSGRTNFASNAGDNTDKANSLVGSLQSVLGDFTNELRVQSAYENKPRPAYPLTGFDVPMPQVRVFGVRSNVTPTSTVNTTLEFGADSILHANNLEQDTFEAINNLRWSRGDHTVKLGGSYMAIDVFNMFRNNSLGTYTFNSFADFEAGRPRAFTRSLPIPGREATAGIAEFTAYESALYAQDEWQVSPRLFLTFGARWDRSWFSDEPLLNPAVTAAFPTLSTTSMPDLSNVSPRFGFTFDPSGSGRQIFRGGTGMFYGRTPHVFFGSAYSGTGMDQLALVCTSGFTAGSLNATRYASFADPANIPDNCAEAGGVAGTPPVPEIVLNESNFDHAYAWKSNLAWDRLLIGTWRLTLEGVYARTRNNYVVKDYNLDETAEFFIEGGRPIFVPATTINTANGQVSLANSRRTNSFTRVLAHSSTGEGKSFQGIVQLRGDHLWGTFYGQYTYDRTRDNATRSCCITGSNFSATAAFLSPNNYDDQWGPGDQARSHTFVISPTIRLPLGFQASFIHRTISGAPYTPTYVFDINGDGASNDRLYVPTEAEVQTMSFAGTTPAARQAQAQLLEQKIGEFRCLKYNRGRVVPRNECRDPWQNVLDARLSKRVRTLRGQDVEVQADFFNLMHGLSSMYGRRVVVLNRSLLRPTGFDPVTRRFRYQVEENFGEPEPGSFLGISQFQAQLGLRYNF